MTIASVIGARSHCIRKYGAVIVDDRMRIVATGYNGPPGMWSGSLVTSEFPDCRAYCPHARLGPGEPAGYHDCPSVHAEANALLFCDRREREGGMIYTTGFPCWDCAKMIANSGLARVVTSRDGQEYRDPSGRVLKMLNESQLSVVLY